MDPICINTQLVPNCELNSCAFIPNSPNIITGGTDKKFHIHQLGNAYRRIDFQCKNSITAIFPLPSTIICGDIGGKIITSFPSVRKSPEFFTAHPSAVNSLDFNSDDSKFISSSNDGSAKIWDFPSRKWIVSLVGHNHWCTSAQFSEDQNIISTSSFDKTVRLWDIRSEKTFRKFGTFKSPPRIATFHPNGSNILIGFENGTFCVFDTRSEVVRQSYHAHSDEISGLRVHPSGNFALTCSFDKSIGIWDLAEGQRFYTITAHRSQVTDAKWNADGSQFLTCDKAGIVKLWQTNFDKLVQTIADIPSSVEKIEERIDEAMEISHPPPKKSSPVPITVSENTISNEMIEGGLRRVVQQIEVISTTVELMEKRLVMSEKLIHQHQEKRKK